MSALLAPPLVPPQSQPASPDAPGLDASVPDATVPDERMPDGPGPEGSAHAVLSSVRRLLLTGRLPLSELLDTVDTAVGDRDIDRLTGDALGEDLIALRRHIDRTEAESSRCLHRFDSVRGYGGNGDLSLVAWMRRHCRLTSTAAAQRVEMARVLPGLPQTESAFRSGELGFQHTAVIARSASEIGSDAVRSAEPALLNAAQLLDPSRLRVVTRHLRHCVDPSGSLDAANHEYEHRRLHISQTFDGVFILDGLLDAEAGALVRTALNALSLPARGDHRSAAQRRADALTELARRQLQSGALPIVAGEKPHLSLTVSAETLRREPGSPAAELRWVGPIVAELARRVACDAALTTISVDGDGRPLNVGRTTRSIPPSIRRALVARDGGCRFPGCDRPPEWTDGHHLQHWADGGETRLDNLVLLCRRHHRTVHEEGWKLSRGPDGQLLAEPP